MAEEFLSGGDFNPPAPNFANLDPRWNRVILIGEPNWVLTTIHQLYLQGFAEVGDWGQPLPTQNPGEAIAVLKCPRV
ncbi:hypothetical protein HJG54_02740 [Leptolyngbya sp. NK1-12]|uniref:Uncharacterized protein n=1 Tax=Leptolyngbya sp. NK1-12 TaxID=2547451 RepID=A0AA96WC83_9CYAN|nr:hypothetical protein [Leptolyngbya sp. NK1-12]WNZ21890.1 hypothetical protein HJG54_02740 [Leptolyngbya sp. NK1-12]